MKKCLDPVSVKSLTCFVFALLMVGVLLMQYGPLSRTLSESSDASPLLRYFSYFTIQSNMLVVIALFSFVVHTWLNRAPYSIFYSAVVVWIVMVGLVYHVVLRQLWSPQGLDRFLDEMLHVAAPLFYTLAWIFFLPKRKLSLTFFFLSLGFPLAYLTWVVVQSQWTDWYPYPFLELERLGLFQFLINVLVLVGLFFLMSLAVFFVNVIQLRLRDRHQSESLD